MQLIDKCNITISREAIVTEFDKYEFKSFQNPWMNPDF